MDQHQDQSVVNLDDGDVIGAGGLPDRFVNPGLPPHVLRAADLSDEGAKRAERQVVGLFTLSILGTLGFLVAYFAIPTNRKVFLPGLGTVSASNAALGVGLGLALLGIGFGAVHWAKTLMPDVEEVESRHELRSSDEDRARTGEILAEGGQSSHLTRRPMLKLALGGAMGLFALPLVVQVVGSMGPLPGRKLAETYWNRPFDDAKATGGAVKKQRLMRDPVNTPIKADEVTIGSVYHVMPEGLLDEEHDLLDHKAKAAVLLMRLDETIIKSEKERSWGYQGIVAYSKICTHVGCPVGLYEQQTHHLLCPCHQSTFDVTDDCKVIFGPAKRPLPQLKISVDDEGYLVADQPFMEPVGPSYWNRKMQSEEEQA